MKRFASLLMTAVCCLLIASASAAVMAKDTWTSVRSKNFSLIGNASEKDIRQVAIRLEQFRDAFTRLFPKLKYNSTTPTTVIVFKSDDAYKPFKPVHQGKVAAVAGYFQPGPDMNYITLSTERRDENLYHTIFHEYVHLLLENTMRNVPVWFNEGLAEYYSTFQVTKEDKQAVLGRLIPNHVLYLREQRLLPLQTLFTVDHHSPHYNEREKKGVFYAQSWALLHYLIIGSKEQPRQPQLGQFINLLLAGTPVEKAFPQAFKTDFAGMEKELKNYIQRNTWLEQTVTFKDKLEFDKELQSAPLTEAEAQAYLGDLLLHINRLNDAEARLQQALTLDPDQPMAQAALGMVRVRQGRFADAKQHLQRAVAANTQNYLTHYYYALALSREGMDSSNFIRSYAPETAQLMRAELEKAIKLNPSYVESYRLLGFINLVTGEQLDESIALLKRAQALAPGKQEIAFVLAQLYMRKQEFNAARQMLEPLAQDGADPQMRMQAQSLLNTVNGIERQISRANARNSETSTNADSARTEETSQEDAVSEPLPSGPMLRKPGDGEQQARGMLLRIECSAKGVLFHVKTADRLLKLSTGAFERIQFTTYTPEVSGEISCGPRNPANSVMVTYRPAKEARAKVDGDVVAIEFLPKDFDEKK